MMKLYYTKADNSLAVRITIHEIGILCEFEAVNLKNKITETGEDYFTINPKGQVPALKLNNNSLLTENAIIQQYLADQYHAHQLLPVHGDFKRYRVLEWLNFISTELHKTCSALYNINVPEEIKENVYRVILKRKLDYVQSHLEKLRFQYLLGDQFTLPDTYLFVVLTWLPHMKMDLTEWPVLLQYFTRLKTRASVQKALEEEGLLGEIE